MKNQDRDRLSKDIDDLINGEERTELDNKTASLLNRLKNFYSTPTVDESFEQELEKKLLKELSETKIKRPSALRLFWLELLSLVGLVKGYQSWMIRRLAFGVSLATILIVSSFIYYTGSYWRTPSAYDLLLKTQVALDTLPPGKVLYEKGKVYSTLPDGTQLKETIVERWVRGPDRMIVAKVSIGDEVTPSKPAPKKAEMRDKNEVSKPQDLKSIARSRAGGEGGGSVLDSFDETEDSAEGLTYEDASPEEESVVRPITPTSKAAAPILAKESMPETKDTTPLPTATSTFTFKETVTKMIASERKRITIIGREVIGKEKVIIIEWKPQPEIISKLYISADSHLPLRMRLELVENDGTRRIVRVEDLVDRKILDALDLPQEFWESGTLPVTEDQLPQGEKTIK